MGAQLGYEPALLAFNIVQSRHMLERLYGVGLERIPEAGEGECDDCGGASRCSFSMRPDCQSAGAVR